MEFYFENTTEAESLFPVPSLGKASRPDPVYYYFNARETHDGG